ncbi:enkurin-like [Melanaphis sacchari]|uniref:enkurin-like n=1 Tax=Melanaphis sacchari TaxID=742174 RepID=UPI000DC1596F|nr:enkurin-like [Melanaphis sacchari]
MSKDQENIKYLIQRPKTPVIKPPMHRSIFNKAIKRDYRLNRNCHQTMGYAEVKFNHPSKFLKKHTRIVKRPFVGNIKKSYYLGSSGALKPLLPNQKCSQQCNRSLKFRGKINNIKRNFLQENIVDVVRKVPPLPKHRVQDSRNGHIMVLDEAGLEPTYVSKKSFGKTPSYIKKINKKNEMEKLAEVERVQAIKPPLRFLPEEERKELLKGLKANWGELYTEFLLLPMVTDSVPKINRKARIENQLNNLEKDINLLERYPSLYVCDH